MSDDLLTKQDLAKHWRVTTKSIENWVKDGLIKPCGKVPGDMRFSPKYIAELEGVEFEKFSPLEQKRLKRELEEWKIRAQKAESALEKVNVIIAQSICYRKES